MDYAKIKLEAQKTYDDADQKVRSLVAEGNMNSPLLGLYSDIRDEAGQKLSWAEGKEKEDNSIR